jgi:hypothetical protein
MITIPNTKKEIHDFLKSLDVPRGATHFRLLIEGRNPVVETLKNIDVAAGCSGEIEFGKMVGRGKNRSFELITPKDKPMRSTKAPRKGTRHTILGHSACAILKALGKAGVKYPEADEILKHHGIEMPKTSVSVQLGFGRNENSWKRHGQPAALTDRDIKSLRSLS